MLEDRDQDMKCQDQDRRISVSSGLETKTAVSRTTRTGQIRVGPGNHVLDGARGSTCRCLVTTETYAVYVILPF